MSGSGVRVLVACDELIVAGGLYRFERFGRSARKLGHQLAYLALNSSPRHGFASEFPVLSFAEAAAQQWDATFVPGAGFPDTTIQAFAMLKDPSFGVRVQHILNDTSKTAAFERVNRSFRPDVIIFNNKHWSPRHFSRFEADAFYFLEGAVNLEDFSPNRSHRNNDSSSPYVVGGLINKNAGPLIEAAQLSDDVVLHLFGSARQLPAGALGLLDQGRLRYFGVLKESELPDFYAGLDCAVHTELSAGWANLAAEAMACGVPVICTPHGTGAFAEDGATALVVPEPTAAALTQAIHRLRCDNDLAERLSVNALERIRRFSWNSYTADLLRLIERPTAKYYTWSPSLGLFGKWPAEERIAGLEWLLEVCEGKTVCDLGCSEGVIAHRLLEAGAAATHGFERESSRVALASAICAGHPNAWFWQADLSDWTQFEADHAPHLRPSYDVVLYLGLHHHLPYETRVASLRGAARRAGEWLIMRTPEDTFASDRVGEVLAQEGLRLEVEVAGREETRLGALFAFKRDPER